MYFLQYNSQQCYFVIAVKAAVLGIVVDILDNDFILIKKKKEKYLGLHLDTNTLGWTMLCFGGSPVPCKVFIGVWSLYSLDARGIPVVVP